jgi:hypothetical protein
LIKSIYKTRINVIFNGEKVDGFPLRPRIMEVLLLTTVFQHQTRIPAKALKQEQTIKRVHIGKKK